MVPCAPCLLPVIHIDASGGSTQQLGPGVIILSLLKGRKSPGMGDACGHTTDLPSSEFTLGVGMKFKAP